MAHYVGREKEQRWTHERSATGINRLGCFGHCFSSRKERGFQPSTFQIFLIETLRTRCRPPPPNREKQKGTIHPLSMDELWLHSLNGTIPRIVLRPTKYAYLSLSPPPSRKEASKKKMHLHPLERELDSLARNPGVGRRGAARCKNGNSLLVSASRWSSLSTYTRIFVRCAPVYMYYHTPLPTGWLP